MSLSSTLRTAFSKNPPSNDASYEEMGRKTSIPNLTQENHAFYIGKVIRHSIADKIKTALGFTPTAPEKKSLYDESFIATMLEAAFSHTEKGHTPHIVVGTSMSSLFNGERDAELFLSPDEEVALLHRVAEKKFNKQKDELRVTKIEEDPAYTDLFTTLRAAVDPTTKQLNVDQAYATPVPPTLSQTSSALDIARFLFWACSRNDALSEAFKNTLPEKLRNDENTPSSAQWYGLTEVALRLHALLNGQSIHGGADRQGVYDELLIKVIAGEKGKWKSHTELLPLFEIVRNKKFGTLHVNTKNNTHKRQSAITAARARLTTYALGALTTVGSIGAAAHAIEANRQEQTLREIDALMNTLSNDITFYFDDSPRWHVDKDKNAMVLRHMQASVLHVLHAGYGVPEEQSAELNEIILQYFINNKEQLSSAYSHQSEFITFIDTFVTQYQLYLKAKQIPTTKPYEQFAPYNTQLFQTANDPIDETVVAADHTVTPIGTFTVASNMGGTNSYELGLYTDAQSASHVVGRVPLPDTLEPGTYPPVRRVQPLFDSDIGKNGAQKYVQSIRLLAARELEKHAKLFNNERCSYDKPIDAYEKSRLTDPFGKFDYEFTIVRPWNDVESKFEEPFLAARDLRAQEESFSLTTGQKVIQLYFDLRGGVNPTSCSGQ